MSVIGYKRVSSEGQNLDRQDLGQVDKVFEEKLSGKSAKARPALQAMIEYAREGDAVVVYSIDRLARDLRDLQDIISTLNDKGVSISFLSGVCQTSCPPISCGVSDFRGAGFVFWVQPDGSCGLPVSGFS